MRQLLALRFADEKRLRHLLSAAPEWKPYANANGGRRGGGGGKPAALAAPTDAVAAAFYYHDDNYSGFLDYRELRNALQTMGINVHMGVGRDPAPVRRHARRQARPRRVPPAVLRPQRRERRGQRRAAEAAEAVLGAGSVASMGAAAEYVPTDASGIVVMYGDNLHVVSCFAAGKTYLDANGHSKQPEALYDVCTHHSARRAGGCNRTGVWSLESAAGIAGAVQYGDELLIRSCFTAAESFLDVPPRVAAVGPPPTSARRAPAPAADKADDGVED